MEVRESTPDRRTGAYTDRPHLPSRIGDTELTYDPSGNLIRQLDTGTHSQQTYVWDDDGRLVEVRGQGANQRNVYDAAGLRVLRAGQAGTTVFAGPHYDVDQANRGQKHIVAGQIRIATVLSPYPNTASPPPPTRPGPMPPRTPPPNMPSPA